MSHTHQHTRTRVRLRVSLRDGDEMQSGTLMTQGGVQTKGNVSTKMMVASQNRTQSVFFWGEGEGGVDRIILMKPRGANKTIVPVPVLACMLIMNTITTQHYSGRGQNTCATDLLKCDAFISVAVALFKNCIYGSVMLLGGGRHLPHASCLCCGCKTQQEVTNAHLISC